jgi:hypothetical protein
MLPFLAPKKMVSIIAARRGKPGVEVASEQEAPGAEMHPGLKAAAEDILRAVEHKSVLDLASALQAAYEICGQGYEEESEEAGE